jgi:hypothetical protein
MILFITRHYPPRHRNGGSLQREQFIKFLAGEGIHSDVVILDNTKNKIWEKIKLQFQKIGLSIDFMQLPKITTELRKQYSCVVSTTGGELGTIYHADKVAGMLGIPHIVIMRDPIVHSIFMFRSGLRRFLYGRRNKLLAEVLKRADRVFCSGEQLASEVVSLLNINSSKVEALFFGYGSENPMPNNQHYERREVISLVYGGTARRAQKLENFIRDFLISSEQETLQIFTNDKIKGSIRVHVKPLVSKRKFLSQLEIGKDVGLIVLGNSYFSSCIPSKFYDFVSQKIPILCYSVDGELRQLVERTGFGVCVQFGNHLALGEAIKALNTEIYDEIVERISNNLSDFEMGACHLSLLSQIRAYEQ